MPWTVAKVKAWSVPKLVGFFGASGAGSWLCGFSSDLFAFFAI